MGLPALRSQEMVLLSLRATLFPLTGDAPSRRFGPKRGQNRRKARFRGQQFSQRQQLSRRSGDTQS